MHFKNKKLKKIFMPVSIALGLIIAMYLGGVLYFNSHFYFGTTINGKNVSGKTVDGANKEITDIIKNYKLTLKGRDGTTEAITASQINLKYNALDKIKNIKKSQNPFNVLSGIRKSKNYEIKNAISYDEEKLSKSIDNLSFFSKDKITNPKNAFLKYNGKTYDVVNEVMGNKVKKDTLYNKITGAISRSDESINLDKSDCYENPKFTAKSKEVNEAKKTLNNYLNSEITFTFGDNKEVLDKDIINTFIGVDENFEVKIDRQKISKYVNNLAYKYDTVGKTRDFVNASGQSIKVNGGSYGFQLNKSKEIDDIVQVIKEGKTVTKKPIYSKVAKYYGSDEIGKTYVEVDLTKQHLWFYKDGSLVTEGDVVTGSVATNHTTPEGVYQIYYKQKNATLKGEGYSSPVTYWMPFNGDIGLHDAWWRPAFGKVIYQTDGSHGCVNCPTNLAQAIFENVDAGTPVVCHN